MSDLDDSFAKLLGSQPTEKQKEELYRVRDALGLKSNDALWLVVFVLQHYQNLYEKFPARIEDAARRTLQSFERDADARARAAAERASDQVERAAVTAAWNVVRKVETRVLLQWLSATLATCVVFLTGFAWLMYTEGEAAGKTKGEFTGYASGYEAARAEHIAAAAAASDRAKGSRIDPMRRR